MSDPEVAQPVTGLRGEPLANHTTFRIGGPADLLAIPTTEEELLDTIQRCERDRLPWRLLGNGSNILVDDEGVDGVVIKMTKACGELTVQDGVVEAGASVTLQAFIQKCVRHNLEGMEYLYSVPATIGGAIYMNAGRGAGHPLCVGDRVEHVRVFDGEAIRLVPREACEFGYRRSIFQQRKRWAILGARFRLAPQSREIGERNIRERMAYVRSSQDWALPSAGSVFKKCQPLLLDWLKGQRVGGARYSPKTRNWIQNIDQATSADVLRLIKRAQWLHRLLACRADLEVEIWGRAPAPRRGLPR